MVTLYTKNNCQPCNITKREFAKLGIQYTEISMDSDPSVVDMLVQRGFQSAPVVVTEEGEAWAGLQPTKIRALAQV